MAGQARRGPRPVGARVSARAPAAASRVAAGAAAAPQRLDAQAPSQAICAAPLELSQQMLQGWCEWQQLQAHALAHACTWWVQWLLEASRAADLDPLTAADGDTPLAMFGPLQAALAEVARGWAQGANFAALRE